MKQVSDGAVKAFVERLEAACREHGANSIAIAAGVSQSAIRNVANGGARPGALLVERVSAALDDPSLGLQTQAPPRSQPRTRAVAVNDLAAEKAIANDPECSRLRALLAVEEARVRKAVAELLGGAS